MEENEKHILVKTADAVIENAVTIDIDIVHPNLWQRWRKITKKKFSIHPICLGTLVKISKELLSIDIHEEDKANILLLSYKLMQAHCERLALIVAYAIVNRKKEPSKALINFLLHNLSAQELSAVAAHVIGQMDVLPFMRSIVSIKGINILGTSLTNRKD